MANPGISPGKGGRERGGEAKAARVENSKDAGEAGWGAQDGPVRSRLLRSRCGLRRCGELALRTMANWKRLRARKRGVEGLALVFAVGPVNVGHAVQTDTRTPGAARAGS